MENEIKTLIIKGYRGKMYRKLYVVVQVHITFGPPLLYLLKCVSDHIIVNKQSCRTVILLHKMSVLNWQTPVQLGKQAISYMGFLGILKQVGCVSGFNQELQEVKRK